MTQISRAKGAEFEKTTCKKLSMWASDFEEQDLFWKSPGSGSRATMSKTDVGRHAGDVIGTDPRACRFLREFYIECKFYADLLLPVFIFGGTGYREHLWEKPCKEAEPLRRRPFVVARQNRKPTLLLTTGAGAERLLRGRVFDPLRADEDQFGVKAVFYDVKPYPSIHIFHFEEMLARTSFEKMFAPKERRSLKS